MLRFLTAGESHGPAEVAILEGMPAGLSITREDINFDLKKRSGGFGRGGRGKIEKDKVVILSGIRHGKTLGSPIALLVENLDFKNWSEQMAIEKVNKKILPVTTPRPGHADLAGAIKYQTSDIRNILERASARETVMRVAIGAICRKFLAEFGIEIASHTVRIGKIALLENVNKSISSYSSYWRKVQNSYYTDPEIRCIDRQVSDKMKQEIKKAMLAKDSLGGVIEVIAHNVPAGLGSHAHWDRKLDGRIAQALMSIPSVKAVEIGEAIKASSRRGSEIQDEIYPADSNKSASSLPFYRKTNRMGGIEGGISNGEDIICRVYHKPLSTLGKPLNTVDLKTKKPTKALLERSDICVIPRAGVISEAMMAFSLADAMLEKFGGDNLRETKRNFRAYINRLKDN